jgi:hypothetical protein
MNILGVASHTQPQTRNKAMPRRKLDWQKKDTKDAYKNRLVCPLKERHNRKIARHSNIFVQSAKNVLVLDDSGWNSSTTFIARMKGVRRIVVPQYSEDEFDNMYVSIPSDLVRLYERPLHDLISSQHKYNVAYLDYCSTVYGNKLVSPLRVPQ